MDQFVFIAWFSVLKQITSTLHLHFYILMNLFVFDYLFHNGLSFAILLYQVNKCFVFPHLYLLPVHVLIGV